MTQKLSRRKFLATVGTVATSAVISACAPAATSTPAAKQPAVTKPAAVPTFGVSTASGTFRLLSANETESRRPVVEKFFKDYYPNFKVSIEVTPANYWEKLLALIAARDVPDLAYMHEQRFLSFAVQGALVALDQYINGTPLIGDKSLYPMDLFKRTTTYNGKLLAMPVGFAVLMIRYNKNLFDKSKVSYPTENWKWEDLVEKGKTLTIDTNNDKTPDQWGWFGWNPGWLPAWWPLMQSYGAWHFNDTLDKSRMGDPEAIQSLEVQRLTWCGDKKASPTPATKSQLQTGTTQLFEGGLAAMDSILSQNVSSSLKAIDNRFEMGLETYPAGPKGRFVRTGGTSYAVPTGAKSPDIAWNLIRYLVGDEEANKTAATYEFGNPLVRLDYVLKYNAPTGNLSEPWKKIVQDAMQKFGTVVQYAPIGEYERICTTNLEKMATCEFTAKQCADAIVAQTDKALKDLK